MVILPGIRVIVRRFLCIERRFLSDWSKKFYVDVLAQCALFTKMKPSNESVSVVLQGYCNPCASIPNF